MVPDSLNNIEIWTSVFMIYMAILLEKLPMKAQEYLKYMQSIRLASSGVLIMVWPCTMISSD